MKKRRCFLAVLFSLTLSALLIGCGAAEEPENAMLPQAPGLQSDRYTYDKAAAGDFELPADLKGETLSLVKLDGSRVPESRYRYAGETKVLVFGEDYMLSLENGEHPASLTSTGGSASFVLDVVNTVSTQFDEHEAYAETGKSGDAVFNVGFGGTTPQKILYGGKELDTSFYAFTADTLTIKEEFVRRTYGTAAFTLVLSNNDRYDFTIESDKIFFTDYDWTTVHNDLISDIGHNPLYQDSTRVAIVEAPKETGMSGKVLRYEPHRGLTPMQVHGIYTLGSERWDSMWYNAGFTEDKYYTFTFDYCTKGSFAGEDFLFCNWPKTKTVALDSAPGVLHHASVTWRGADFEQVLIWAVFAKGGELYVDNFSVTETDSFLRAEPVKSDYEREDRYDVTVEENGYALKEVLIDGEAVAYTYENQTISVNKAVMDGLSKVVHTFTVESTLNRAEFGFRCVADKKSVLRDTQADYLLGSDNGVRLYGTFDDGLEIVSLTQKAKTNDGGDTGKNYDSSDTSYGYEAEKYARLISGADDTGYLELTDAFASRFYGTTDFSAELSNGKELEFTLRTNSLLSIDYDGVTVSAPFLFSGLVGVTQVRESEPGNRAFFVDSTEGSEANTAYTIKLHDHVWGWFKVPASGRKLSRITFDYKIVNLPQDAVKATVVVLKGTDPAANFFGSGYSVDKSFIDRDEIQWALTSSGQTCTFDSGWFTFDDPRMFKVELSAFTAANEAQIVFDNFRLTQTTPPVTAGGYEKGAGSYGFDVADYAVTGVRIDGNTVAFTQNDGRVSVAGSVMDALTFGKHVLTVSTAVGDFGVETNVTSAEVARLDETSKTFARGAEELKLAGEFDPAVTVTRLTRIGSNNWDPNGTGNPAVVAPALVRLGAVGLTVSAELLDSVYKTFDFAMELSNGANLTFSLTSSAWYYTDFDLTTIYEHSDRFKNLKSFQDTDMLSFAMGEEALGGSGKSLCYTPGNATQPHSTSSNHNGIFTFQKSSNGTGWWDFPFEEEKSYEIFFDYKIEPGTAYVGGEAPLYQFNYMTNNLDEFTAVPLEGTSGTFRIVLKGSEFIAFRINCEFSTVQKDSYMLVDRFGFGEAAHEA